MEQLSGTSDKISPHFSGRGRGSLRGAGEPSPLRAPRAAQCPFRRADPGHSKSIARGEATDRRDFPPSRQPQTERRQHRQELEEGLLNRGWYGHSHARPALNGLCLNQASRAMSASTMRRARSSGPVSGCHPRSDEALLKSPTKLSTSVGRT